MPASMARSMSVKLSGSLVCGPKFIVPRQSGLTSRPVRPRWRYSMTTTLRRAARPLPEDLGTRLGDEDGLAPHPPTRLGADRDRHAGRENAGIAEYGRLDAETDADDDGLARVGGTGRVPGRPQVGRARARAGGDEQRVEEPAGRGRQRLAAAL